MLLATGTGGPWHTARLLRFFSPTRVGNTEHTAGGPQVGRLEELLASEARNTLLFLKKAGGPPGIIEERKASRVADSEGVRGGPGGKTLVSLPSSKCFLHASCAFCDFTSERQTPLLSSYPGAS